LRGNCLVKHITEGKIEGGIEVTERQRRRSKQLLDDLQETIEKWKLKDEALDRIVLRTRFRSGYGPAVRQDYGMNE
jgi:ribosome-binding factor A